jgi:cytochrome c
MKTIGLRSSIFIFAILLISCGGDQKKTEGDSTKTIQQTKGSTFPLADQGKVLFEGPGTCIACHQLDTKIVGPSIIDIATIYKENNASIAAFLNEECKPLVDPSQYSVMKTNFAITKNMKPEERLALEHYMMSQIK